MDQAIRLSRLFGELGETLEWRKWVEEIPYIRWPNEWEVKAIPPFAGAVIRYLVRREGLPEGDRVSVYLDCYDILGYVGEPYWEVYPGDEEGETGRCLMAETDTLLVLIEAGLDYLANTHTRPYK